MGISVTEAAIVAIIIESILYGISTFLFGITLWSLTYQRKSAEVSRIMLAAACLLFLLGTMHIIVDANRVWQGFISSGDADLFFDDLSKYSFKNALYQVETVVGDAILIYRCYVVWRRIDVIIIPIIAWMATAVVGTFSTWLISQPSITNSDYLVVLEEAEKWVIPACSMALATNLIATSVLAYKLWSVHRRSSGMRTTRSQVYPILLIIMECGALYSLSLITILSTYIIKSNSGYIVVDMIGQIIPITFFLIIVRAAMLRFGGTSHGLSTHTETSDRLPVARNMKVQIDRVRVVGTDDSEVSKVYPSHADSKVNNSRWNRVS